MRRSPERSRGFCSVTWGEGYLLQKTIFNALTIALLLSQ